MISRGVIEETNLTGLGDTTINLPSTAYHNIIRYYSDDRSIMFTAQPDSGLGASMSILLRDDHIGDFEYFYEAYVPNDQDIDDLTSKQPYEWPRYNHYRSAYFGGERPIISYPFTSPEYFRSPDSETATQNYINILQILTIQLLHTTKRPGSDEELLDPFLP